MKSYFKDKVTLVTGAGSGMGEAAAKAFAELGAAVALADINESSVNALAEQLTKQGHKAIAIKCDVASEQQVKAMVETMFSTGNLVEEDAIKAQPIGRLGTAKEVADAVVWLCGPGASFVIGQPIAIDGGYTIM